LLRRRHLGRSLSNSSTVVAIHIRERTSSSSVSGLYFDLDYLIEIKVVLSRNTIRHKNSLSNLLFRPKNVHVNHTVDTVKDRINREGLASALVITLPLTIVIHYLYIVALNSGSIILSLLPRDLQTSFLGFD